MYANCLPHHNKNIVELPEESSTFDVNRNNPHPTANKDFYCAYCACLKHHPKAKACSNFCRDYMGQNKRHEWAFPEADIEGLTLEPVKDY